MGAGASSSILFSVVSVTRADGGAGSDDWVITCGESVLVL